MIFVGVDPSLTNTGIVLLDAEGAVLGAYNSRVLLKKKNKDVLWHVKRLAKYRDYLVGVIKNHCGSGPVCVAYENYSYDSVNKAFTTGELGGVLRLALVEAFGDNLILVEPRRLKKFATGTGVASKERMVNAALKESSALQGLKAKDQTDDVCDAYFLAKMAWYYFFPKKACVAERGNEFLRSRLEICKQIKDGK